MAAGSSSGPVNMSLTDEELAALAEGLSGDKRPTVYLREALPSLGLPEGCSARVVSISGRSLTVRPRGVDDELPFEAEELRFTRKAPAAAKRAPRKAPAVKAVAKPVAIPAAKPGVFKPVVMKPVVMKPAAAAVPEVVAKPAAARQTRARRGPASVIVTIEGTADNEWTVAVQRGAKRLGKPAPITADAVGRAFAELGDETASAEVTELLNAARLQAEARVAELARQLEEAQQALLSLRPAK